MGINMGLFKKEKGNDSSSMKNMLKGFHSKKINYVSVNLNMLNFSLNQSITKILDLTPFNYYQSKKSFTRAIFYSSANYIENYVIFEQIELKGEVEKTTEQSKYYSIDRDTLEKAFCKAGIMI